MSRRLLGFLTESVEPWIFRLQAGRVRSGWVLAGSALVLLTPPTLLAGTPIVTPLVTAYIVGIAAYLIDRQEVELERLEPVLLRPEMVSELFERSLRCHPRWLLLLGWILGPLVMLAVNFTSQLVTALRAGEPPDLPGLWAISSALFFWVIFVQMLFVFGRNAMLFHRLGSQHVRIDLLDLRSVNPFGRIAIRNLLIFIGGLALAPLQLFSGPSYVTQIAVGSLIVLPCGVALMLLPMWAIHSRLSAEKALELQRIQDALAGSRSALAGSPIAEDAEGLSVMNLVLYREMIAGIREWPVDASAVARFAGYVVIPLLAWIGAALVERWIDVVVMAQ